MRRKLVVALVICMVLLSLIVVLGGGCCLDEPIYPEHQREKRISYSLDTAERYFREATEGWPNEWCEDHHETRSMKLLIAIYIQNKAIMGGLGIDQGNPWK